MNAPNWPIFVLPIVDAVGLLDIAWASRVEGQGSMLGEFPMLTEKPTLSQPRLENPANLQICAIIISFSN